MERYGVVAVIVLILMIGMLGYVHERVKVLELSKQIDALKAERTSLEDLNKRLSVRVARLSRSDRIVRLATEELGMRFLSRSPMPLEERWGSVRRIIRFFRVQIGWVKHVFSRGE
jgi:cell division protein FtsL